MRNEEIYDTDSSVTKEILDRFKDEKFVFVAERKFVDFTKDAHKQYYKTSNNDTHYKSPMSNNNLEENVVYAHRITHDGHEYLAKFDAERVKNMISGHHTKP